MALLAFRQIDQGLGSSSSQKDWLNAVGKTTRKPKEGVPFTAVLAKFVPA
jgi:hypothetical protein